MEKISMSNEDYLEAIIMLGGTVDESVKSVDISRKLNVSRTAVNKAIAVLKKNNLVSQPYYGDITLTEEGYKYGQAIYKRHRCLVAFFTKGLGIEPETAENEACLMEHAISDESFELWVAYVSKLGFMNENEA